ncbi:uncharacterized protein LOC124431568 [Vespa crabro]|uniref:uncharacterized protein LOC124431568 n=1 Tax=Vespa crabro TaxID=7445 RepID=UPI001F0246FA|nr:uncharacterized protein LOC124431568 [Vespa crabro]
MEVFEHPYYRLNKRLLLLIGQWPYQHKFDQRFRMCFVTSLLFSFGITQISLLYTNGDVDTLIEIIPPITSLITITSKYSMFYICRNNIKNLFERIIKHWKLWESKEEMDIMRKYSEEGKLLTFFYTSYIYSCMTLFLLMPFFPFIMDIIVPLNESRPLRPIFKSEYFIDEDQHFFPIYFHMSIVIVVGITVLISNDVLLLIFNSHVCGIFTTVGFRLEHLLKNQTNMINLLDYRSRRMCFKNVVRTIEIHKRALEFADLIESSYSFFLLSQVGSSLVCMSLSLYQILMSLDKPPEALTFLIFACAQFLHLLCICYPGQRMIDYSTDIRTKAYNGLWYKAPIEIHRLVLLIIQRSIEPCYLTAGKTFIFCLETFSKNALRFRNVMDSFEHHYYKFNKRLLVLVGQWPYQNSIDRCFRRCIVNFIFIIFVITQVALIYTCNGNIDVILETIPNICGFIIILIKYYTYQIQRNEMQYLLKHITKNWKIWETQEEMNII